LGAPVNATKFAIKEATENRSPILIKIGPSADTKTDVAGGFAAEALF
jgi:hypothetical protein